MVLTSALAVIFLGRKLKLHHYVAILMIVFSIAIIAIVGVMNSPEKKDSVMVETTPLGIGLILLGQCFAAILFTVEEYFLKGYNVDPLFVVGCEGFWGVLIYAILLPIF